MYETTIQGMTLHYDRLGAGEPLVLLHGFGERKEGWTCQHALADRYELIIPDLRGHGASTHTEGITMENFARDVLLLLDELGIEAAHICGLSMGGVVAQELYRQAPERCKSLLLVSTYFAVPSLFRDALYVSWLWRLNWMPRWLRMRTAVMTCLAKWDEATVERYFQAMVPEKHAYKQTLAACVDVDHSQLLREIRVPTLIVGSDWDLLTPVWIQRQMHREIPGSQFVMLKGAGHMAKLEQPEVFNRVVREFLELQAAKAGAL